MKNLFELERINATELLAAYDAGRREFHYVNLDGVSLFEADLRAASFYGSSLRGVDLSGALLTYIQLKCADLECANLQGAFVNASDLIDANFTNANLSEADFTGASFHYANFTGSDLRGAYLGNSSLAKVILQGADLTKAHLSGTYLDDLDVRPLCDATNLKHSSPSHIDANTVMQSYTHPGLKQFMIDCGVPPLFAEYMIDCARSLGEPLVRQLMRKTFISYGGPDEPFARKLYYGLRDHNVNTFFFPESATVGERISAEVFQKIQDHDRILLICSKSSLDRPGVINEIQETIDRETRDGGATYLLPIMLDDYVLTGWAENRPELAERVRRRVIADFRGADRNNDKFSKAFDRVIDALKIKKPSS